MSYTKLSRMKELVGKTGVLVRLDLPSGVGELKQGSNPHIGQLSESEEKHVRLRGKQLICGSLNGMRIRQSLLLPHVPPDRDAGALEGTAAGSWSLGMGAIPG